MRAWGRGALLVAGLGAGSVGVFAVAGWAVGVANQMVVLEQAADEKWAQVQTVYQRRADLVPNLVQTVKGYAAHERGTLEAVTQARARATAVQLTPEAAKDPEALRRFTAAQGELAGALGRLLVVLERYPKLKADRGFLALQAQLEETENRITVERQRFNATVLDYNTRLRLFPGNLVAARAGYRGRAFFEAEEGAARAPVVKFP